MTNRYLTALVFSVGLAAGWLANAWWASDPSQLDAFIASVTDDKRGAAVNISAVATDSQLLAQSELASSSPVNSDIPIIPINSSAQERQRNVEDISSISIIERFGKLLNNRQYYDAMTLLQEQELRSSQNAAVLKVNLLSELERLIEVRDNNGFSELVESYLSIYYDDIRALLLLAELNQINGSYLEAVNVFLLATTYAYSRGDQENVASQFNNFVKQIDGSYTRQKDWWSLINLYAYIDTSGLMTSNYQYQQALAYLRSGDEAYAIAQLNLLLDDALVGEAAAKALTSLTESTEAPVIVSTSLWDGADPIELERHDNQYAVNLANTREDNVKLLIDTGASMTAISRDSFDKLNPNGDAVEQERRVFRTANGLIQATVFLVPELSLGVHRLENTQIAVIDFDTSRGIEGLLGMNILGQFRFQIDQDNAELLLNRK